MRGSAFNVIRSVVPVLSATPRPVTPIQVVALTLPSGLFHPTRFCKPALRVGCCRRRRRRRRRGRGRDSPTVKRSKTTINTARSPDQSKETRLGSEQSGFRTLHR